MAGFMCNCGASLSNVDLTTNSCEIFRAREVENAIKNYPLLQFHDFCLNWNTQKDCKELFVQKDFDFWFCHKCGRVYKLQSISCGKCASVYKPVKELNDTVDISTWERIYAYSYKEIDKVTDKDEHITLDDFINKIKHKHDFYISPDLSTVAVCKHKTKELVSWYVLEVKYDV